MITVLVVDDHDLLREGVSSCLSAFDDLEVVGESASGEEGLEAASRLRPDVVVIDLIMPGIGGVEAIRRLRDADESIGLLALSTFAHGDLIREAIDAGASGYLVKSVDTEGLAQAVRDVAAGRGSFSSDVTRVLAAAPRSAADVTARFTEREAEVAELVARRAEQRRHRRVPQPQRVHGQESRQQHSHETAGPIAHRGGGDHPAQSVSRRRSGLDVAQVGKDVRQDVDEHGRRVPVADRL